ncbi:hypothetical protein NL676_000443 [Syzygium grande]|nr:hypothetical protein NL676_000443 [Syzygium grande]
MQCNCITLSLSFSPSMHIRALIRNHLDLTHLQLTISPPTPSSSALVVLSLHRRRLLVPFSSRRFRLSSSSQLLPSFTTSPPAHSCRSFTSVTAFSISVRAL